MSFWKVAQASSCRGNHRTELIQWLVWDTPQTLSGFTEDNWEIYMDAWVVERYNSLEGHKREIKSVRLIIQRTGVTELKPCLDLISSPEVLGFCESSSVWPFYVHFLSQLFLHRIRGPNHHLHQRTESCNTERNVICPCICNVTT